VVPGLCSYEWVQDKLEKWGEDDPRFISRVAGKLPTVSIDTIFSFDIIDRMIDRETFESNVYKGVGVDVGHFGDDESVIYGGTNGKVEKSMMYAGEQTDVTAGRALIVNNSIGGNFIAVDEDGLGVGTGDTLRSMKLKGITIVSIKGSAAADDEQYANKRAEMWFIALERAKKGNASLPNDPLLHEELAEVKYFINKKGKIQIEEKIDIKDRLGRSPNRADAWIYYQYAMSKATRINVEKYETHTGAGSGAVLSSVAGKGGMAG
jgi:hypothetical protein